MNVKRQANRKARVQLSAVDRMALRLTWFVFYPDFLPLTQIAESFNVTRATISNLTEGAGFVKTPAMFEGEMPGKWRDKLFELYAKERKPGDLDTFPAYFVAYSKAKTIRKKWQRENSKNEAA